MSVGVVPLELVAVEPADPADADVGHGWQQTRGT
jgi:hypothetical protein